ncbi:MAG: nucleoside-diphosphate sugar epimerase [Candidatus Thermofonsia Clade 1 bacterium]|uniref:UDP-glucuronate decarboxylase n=1 Tax=Candidatus Thermofonsia Clade 1 bacterium TaxID=2364210 RepID=A0A2M8PB52_9CHLR|nr:MAG: nucleoside-diphosphate sugar epimerase [Candidatus Thermofonsia Clade 1 bacterium]RMF52690.1 MAG: NAD-dependent epimerase/dehydratase family protein [Chloroflexota bacterium]
MATRALITGGAGFIGSHLAEQLLNRGYEVTVIDNLSTGRFENIAALEKRIGFRYAIEDIRNATVMDRLVSECDVIYHLAAAVGVLNIVSSPIDTIEINVGGTEVVLKTARRYRRKVLLASTSEVYGKNEKVPFNEDDDRTLGPTTKSRWSYAASKELDEFLALAYHRAADLPVVIFRLFNTVGARQRGHYGMVVPRFVRWALRNEPIQVYGDGTQQRCFCNVNDVVQAIIGLGEAPNVNGEVFNIGSNEEISIYQLAERIKARTGSHSEIQLIPYDQAYEAGFEDMRRRVPDISKIRACIGWQPTTPLDETIDQIIAYQKTRLYDDKG